MFDVRCSVFNVLEQGASFDSCPRLCYLSLPPTTIQNLTTCLTFAGIAVILMGCSSPGYKKSNAAAEAQAQNRALDFTIGALRDLINEPNGDLREPYQHFSSSLDQFVAEARRTENSGRRMAESNAAYLQAWDKAAAGIEYQHVRELSQSRKVEVANQFDAVHRRYEETQAVVQPLIAYLVDIRK